MQLLLNAEKRAN